MAMPIRCKHFIFIIIITGITLLGLPSVFSQQKKNNKPVPDPKKLALVQAVVCENIKDFAPQNEAVVFSMAIGRVNCFTYFEPVTETTFIYHDWYFQDKLTARMKLTLKPPNWKTYSTIQLRESDKGPWRIEITDSKGRLFKILRFSVVD